MLYFKLYPFTLLEHLVVSHSYLWIWVNCRSVISQVIIYLKVFKRWISILNLALFCSTLPLLPLCSTRCWLASVSLFVALVCLGLRVVLLVVHLSLSQSLLLWFGLLRTSSRSARCSLVSISIFHALCCSTPWVTLLILDLSPSQSFFLWFAQHLESLCSL